MKKILFMPLLRMPSGHHQVADSMVEMLKDNQELQFNKIELLSYSFGFVESVITSMYLHSIRLCPNIYSRLYRKVSFNKQYDKKSYRLYEYIFLPFMKKVIKTAQPDLIICTHALPSYLLSKLKEKSRLQAPVINIYTDFFVNQLWGISHIDYHFAPTQEVNDFLKKQGVQQHRIFVTGIPVHPHYMKDTQTRVNADEPFSIIVSGGSLGAGKMKKLLKKLNPSGRINYKVLCGKNEKLFHYIHCMDTSFIEPLPYISCKKEMDELYKKSSGIITKPGGVTLSETLRKQLPIFVYSALPGQEEINLNTLLNKKLVVLLNEKESVEQQLLNYLLENQWVNEQKERIRLYLNSLQNNKAFQGNLNTIINQI